MLQKLAWLDFCALHSGYNPAIKLPGPECEFLTVWLGFKLNELLKKFICSYPPFLFILTLLFQLIKSKFSSINQLTLTIYFLGSYCNDCRDLDLCRDSALLSQEWRCAVPQCGQPYDREVMENALLQIVRQRERLYQLQDLVCLRCKQVKAAHIAEQCACAGSYRCREDVSEFRSKMQIFLNIAVHQKFQLLQECTSWILEIR